ncbi:MAG TPA: site-specific DNA-methyltransferase [Pedobacter sp.]
MDEWVNQVIEGDCLEVMSTFPAQSIDMVLADLPYESTHNSWDKEIDLHALWSQYKRIIKPSGVIVLTGHGIFTAKLILSNPEMFRYKIVWIKSKATNFLNVLKQPLRKHEDICVFYQQNAVFHPQMTKGTPYNRGMSQGLSDNYNAFKEIHKQNLTGDRYPPDIIFYPEEIAPDYLYFKTAETEGSTYHATQKPVALGRYLIRSYSNPNDIILDNACGSGSFLVAAIQEGRRFIGIEKNRFGAKKGTTDGDLFKICARRIAAAYKERDQTIL